MSVVSFRSGHDTDLASSVTDAVQVDPTLVASLAKFAFTHPTTLEDLAEFHRRVKAMQWPTPFSVDVNRVNDVVRLEVRLGQTVIKQSYVIT